MTITIKIKDEQQLAQIETLRGEKTAAEFGQHALETGLRVIAQARKSDAGTAFAGAKPEFGSLDVTAITAALKKRDEKDPVVIEVGRLVNAYAAQLKELAQKNGNRLPTQMRVRTQSVIEKIALQITAQAIKSAGARRQTANSSVNGRQ